VEVRSCVLQDAENCNIKTAYLLEKYVGTDDCQWRYIRGRASCVCRTKHGRETRALWGICYCHRKFDAIDEMSYKPMSL
jgi:hypothetical protein